MTEAEKISVGTVSRTDEHGVAWLTIDNTKRGNALLPEMRTQLAAWFDEISSDPAIRAVVLGAAGDRFFCTGADIAPKPAGEQDEPPRYVVGDVARTLRIGWQRLVTSIMDCEKPVIAAVNGTTAGAGCHLALACDLVVLADNAKFVEVFVRRGIVPDAAGMYLLPRLVGPQKAKELMFLGDDVSAEESLRIGLVNRVVPAAELHAAVSELAGRLASSPTRVLQAIKTSVNRSLESSLSTMLHTEALFQEVIRNTEDAAEGRKSFQEKRSPVFKGI